MQDNQVKEFYQKVAEVCRAYDVQGLAGVWFSRNTDNWGQIIICDIADTQLNGVLHGIAKRFDGWLDVEFETIENIRDLSYEKKADN